MSWFRKSKSSFNVLLASPEGVPVQSNKRTWTTTAASTTTFGVDPPQLSEYQFTGSPQHDLQPPPGPQYQSNLYSYATTIQVEPHLDTINEAVPRPGRDGYEKNRNGELPEGFLSPPLSPLLPETAAEIDQTSTHLPNDASHASAQPRPTSPVNSATSTGSTNYSYPISTTTTVVNQLSVLPPSQTVTSPTSDSLSKPTCSLNLMCYRSGSQGCIRRQIQVASKIRWAGSSYDRYEKTWQDIKDMIHSDEQFFQALHQEYEQHICGFWRRYLSLKTLRQIRLLSYTPTTRPEVVPMDDFTLQEVFYAYQHPESIKTEVEWIEWVFRLRQADRRHALEFVEDWSGFRIGLVGSVPWVVATVVGIAWTARGGDAQTAFTVAGFILTVGTSLLALLAIVSKIES